MNTRSLTIPWARNQWGSPQKAGDPNLRRGLDCCCRCPNCDDRLIHRNGKIKRPHFAHHSKQPTQSCVESSIHLAYKNAFLGTEGATLNLPVTPEPSAMGKEPWLMTPEFTVASATTEAIIEMHDGTKRVVDVLLVSEDGRRLAVEIAVTNPKDETYQSQMQAINMLAVEHQAAVNDPDHKVPSADQILAESSWLWEPYSGPLREARGANRTRYNLLTCETQIRPANRITQHAAEAARQDPYGTHMNLLAINKIIEQLHPVDQHQKQEWDALHSRVHKGLTVTHEMVEDAEKEKYRRILRSIEPDNNPKIQTIQTDKYGSWLRRDTKDILNRRARRTAELGFRQQSSRPTLFKARAGQWTIYVDFDSTEVMRIWEVDCEPAIYAFPESDWAEREMLLAEVARTLDGAGVPYRRYFEDDGWQEPTTCPICTQQDSGDDNQVTVEDLTG